MSGVISARLRLCGSFAFATADFDVNRAAEYHFTHPEDLQEAEAGPVVTTPTSRLQQVEVRSTAPPGHAMTILVVGRGQFSVVVPEHVQVGELSNHNTFLGASAVYLAI